MSHINNLHEVACSPESLQIEYQAGLHHLQVSCLYGLPISGTYWWHQGLNQDVWVAWDCWRVPGDHEWWPILNLRFEYNQRGVNYWLSTSLHVFFHQWFAVKDSYWMHSGYISEAVPRSLNNDQPFAFIHWLARSSHLLSNAFCFSWLKQRMAPWMGSHAWPPQTPLLNIWSLS